MDHYRSLCRFLASVKDVLISIEVMPTEPEPELQRNLHHPFLFVDGNIGIPQSILFKAYLVASQQLSHLTLNGAHDASNLTDDLVSTTATLLIANPAHNTALNRRKQLIQMYPWRLTVDDDIKFVAALFGIKQAAKSSLLWHHRRWLFRNKYGMSNTRADPEKSDPDSLEHTTISVEILSTEFKLVARASEIYPRNYHAWLHRYLCAQCLISQVKEGVPGALEVLFLEVEASQRWVELHISDYTAVQYLTRLVIMVQSQSIHVPLLSLPYSDTFHAFTAPISTCYKYPIFLNALSLVGSYPTHESLWLYLRLAWNGLEDQNRITNRWIIDLVLSLNENNHLEGYLPNALISQIRLSCRIEDLPFIRKSALRFLVWTMILHRVELPNDVIARILTDPELSVNYLVELCS